MIDSTCALRQTVGGEISISLSLIQKQLRIRFATRFWRMLGTRFFENNPATIRSGRDRRAVDLFHLCQNKSSL
jgi:hypothetical protein